MHIRPAHLVPMLLVIWLLGGCAAMTASGGSYFPLDPGLRWQYRLTVERPDGSWQSTLEVLNVGLITAAGVRYHARRSDSGVEHLYLETSEGILHAGTVGAFDRRPRLEAVPQTVLRYPLIVDQQWQRQSGLRVLTPWQVAGNGAVGRPPRTFAVSHRIAAMDDAVNVPAGRFRGVIRVESEALVDWPRGPGNGPLRVRTREWYAAGVGLVRLERSEYMAGARPMAGTVRMELVTLNHPPGEAEVTTHIGVPPGDDGRANRGTFRASSPDGRVLLMDRQKMPEPWTR